MSQTSSDRAHGMRYSRLHKLGVRETSIASKLEESSNRLRERVSARGVVQAGVDVINEPDTKHDCIFLDGGNFQHWSRKANPHIMDKLMEKEASNFEEITISNILSEAKTSRGKRILFLGPAGIGKTTILNRLILHNLLKEKIVIETNFRDFDPSQKMRPSQVLLRQMFDDGKAKEMEEGYQWIRRYSDNVTCVVDSLDTSRISLEKKHETIEGDEPACIEDIAHSLFSGKLLPGAIVISSSREYKVRNMHESIQPEQCIIIDGLTKESVKALLEGFLGKDRAAEALDHIRKECPDIWPLLKIPVFLQYTAIAFASKNDGFKPKTMSGILIKYFENLARSPHVNLDKVKIEDILRKLMPMCFNAMKEAKVQFIPEDLDRAGVEKGEVTDLGTLLPQHGASSPLVGKLMHDDRFYLYFNHQTLQECLAALEALSANKRKFKGPILKEAEEENFTVVLRLMCGILFNDEVLEAAANFVEISDVEEKRRMLLKSLESNLERALEKGINGKVLEIFINLNEAKNGVSDLIRSCIRKIDFSGQPLNASDVQAIAFVMAQCECLDKVNFAKTNLDEEKIDILAGTLMNSNVKIDNLDLSSNKQIAIRMASIAKLSKHCDVKDLGISYMDLKTEYLDQFAVENQFRTLRIWKNDEIAPRGWNMIGRLMALNAFHLDATLCNLDASKVSELDKGLGMKTVKAVLFRGNEDLGPEGCHAAGELVKRHEVEAFDLGFCKLDAECIKRLNNGLDSAKVDVLKLSDHFYEPRYFVELLIVLRHVKKQLDLAGWEINEEEKNDLQEKLNEIGSPDLEIIVGGWRLRKILILRASDAKMQKVPTGEAQEENLNETLPQDLLSADPKQAIQQTDTVPACEAQKDVLADILPQGLTLADPKQAIQEAGKESPSESCEAALTKISEEPSPIDQVQQSQQESESSQITFNTINRVVKDVVKDMLNEVERDVGNLGTVADTSGSKEIEESLKRVTKKFSEIRSVIDNNFAVLQDTSMSPQDRSNLLRQTARMYLSMGKFKKCIDASQLAINTLEELGPPDQNAQVTLFDLFCYITKAFNRSLAHESAVKNYANAWKIFNNLPFSTQNYKTLSDRIQHLKSLLIRSEGKHRGVTQSISTGGGVLELPDCTLYFQRGSVISEVLIYAAISFPVAKMPDGKIFATPVLRLIPNIELKAPIKVRLATWLVSPGSSDLKICYRAREGSVWEEIKTIPTLHSSQNVIEFEIDKFCQYTSSVDENGDAIFKVVSLLFYDPIRKMMANKFTPKSDVALTRMREIMTKKNFREACPGDPVLKVKCNDEIQVSVKNFQFSNDVSQQSEESCQLKITAEFLNGLDNGNMKFNLPFKASGIVQFDHISKHISAKGPSMAPVVHEGDRVTLDGPATSHGRQHFDFAHIQAETAYFGGEGSTSTEKNGASNRGPPNSQQ